MSKLLDVGKVHNSWSEFFCREDIKNELKKIDELIGDNFTPKPELVLRFTWVDLKSVTAIIWGKDPYPQKCVATGRSFEVSGVKSWFDSEVNSSLKNIIKLINKTYLDKEYGSGIDEVRSEIENGVFAIPTPNEAFDYWESQGVLFLNTAFTCEIGGINEAGSHLIIWKTFFTKLLDYIVEKNPNIKHFLWGDSRKYAKKLIKKGVNEDNIYLALHPCTNGDKGGYTNNSRFLNCPCFHETKGIINWIYIK